MWIYEPAGRIAGPSAWSRRGDDWLSIVTGTTQKVVSVSLGSD